MAGSWVPLVVTPGAPGSFGGYGLNVIGRLKPGVAPERASAELRGLVTELTPVPADKAIMMPTYLFETEEHRALLASHSEPGYLKKAFGILRGPMGGIMWMVNIAGAQPAG